MPDSIRALQEFCKRFLKYNLSVPTPALRLPREAIEQLSQPAYGAVRTTRLDSLATLVEKSLLLRTRRGLAQSYDERGHYGEAERSLEECDEVRSELNVIRGPAPSAEVA